MLSPELALNIAGATLAAMCTIGAFDIAYFHRRACLPEDPAGRFETVLHVIRGVVYAAQLALLPNVRFSGLAYLLLVGVYLVDVAVALVDVWIEPKARASRGGLPRGEYFAHVVLSILAGVYLTHVAWGTVGWMSGPTELALEANMALPLRLLLGGMAAVCLLVTLYEALELVGHLLPEPPPIHVRVFVPADIRALWDRTQDHRLHPRWDHRFSRIVMLGETIRAGTEMRYERRMLGLTLRGFGRYKHHRPLAQSTFEFWSDDPRSLIRRGVGVWLYRAVPGGAELWTSYRYDVRWGGVGRLIDRFLFRPWMTRATGRSFQRLAREHFGVARPLARWSMGKPLPLRSAGA